MCGYLSVKTRTLNISTVITITSLTGAITENSMIGARKAERKVRPKLTCVDFIFDQGLPASRVNLSILNVVLTSSLRLAWQGLIIFDDPWPSCPSIPL